MIPVDICLAGILIIVGSYGSGKTEIAINLGINKKKTGIDVTNAALNLAEI